MSTPTFKYKFEKFLLSLNPDDLPDARHLSIDFVRMYARRISEHFTKNPPTPTKNRNYFEYKSEIYGITIRSKIPEGVINRAKCKKFWTRSIENKNNEDRLLYEARNKIVGHQQEPDKPVQLYCSDNTLKRTKEKADRNKNHLSKRVVKNTKTGKTKNLLEIATRNEETRALEMYHIIKNLEYLADENGFRWLFITLTAPAEYHPNPSKGKRRYNFNKKIKESHEYIRERWGQIQAVLCSRGIPASPDSYFGVRTVEPHKDGSIHWHILLFARLTSIDYIIKAITEKFHTEAAAKIVIGKECTEEGSAKAASYIYKYISKSLSQKDPEKCTEDEKRDAIREENDLATIKNKVRVQAALKSIRVRQYQNIGVGRLLTMYRKINKINMDELEIPLGSLPALIKEKIWRNRLGFYHMLKHIAPLRETGEIRLVTEASSNSYGERTKRVIAIKIGDMEVSTKSEYKIERIKHMTN